LRSFAAFAAMVSISESKDFAKLATPS